MSKNKNPRSSNYTVGYGRPPKATQFAPGNKANPAGRPKGSRSVAAVVKDIFEEKIALTANGKSRRVTGLEAVVRRLRNDALRGDPTAVKQMISLAERFSESPETAGRLADFLVEDKVILERWLRDPSPFDPDPPLRPNDGRDGDGI